MSCTLEDLTDPRIRFEELWVMEKQYCGSMINKMNLIELFLFYFNKSAFPVLFLCLVYIFVFLRICNLFFDKIFFKQIEQMLKRKKLFETEIAIYLVGIPFFLISLPRYLFIIPPTRQMLNLVYCNGFIILGLTILPLQLIFFSKHQIKFLQQFTSVTITYILVFVVFTFVMFANKVMNYLHAAIGFVIIVTYLVFVYYSVEKDQQIELAWKRNHPTSDAEQVIFYPEEPEDEDEEQEEDQEENEDLDDEDAEEEDYDDLISGSELIDDSEDVEEEEPEPEPEPEPKEEDKEQEKLKSQEFDEEEETDDQAMKAQIIDELEEELKEETPYWIKVRRLYINDEDLSSYALDNLITYTIIVVCILTIPSSQNPFVSNGLYYVPLVIGYTGAYYNLFEKVIDSLIAGPFLFLIHLSIRSFIRPKNRFFLDSMAVFVFIWMFIVQSARYSSDIMMFLQFYYDFHVSIRYTFLCIAFIIPFVFFNISMLQRGRVLLAVTCCTIFVAIYPVSMFVFASLHSLLRGMNIFDFNHPDFINTPISYIVPMQEIFVALTCIVYIIYMMLKKSLVGNIFGVSLLLIALCFISSMYSVSQIEYDYGLSN